MNKKELSINKRQIKQKELLLKQLEKTPIVEVACQRAGVGRTSYYRWKSGNKSFQREADAAIKKGRLFINEMAESQIISAIRDNNLTATFYWLKHNHPRYSTKIEIDAKHKIEDGKLTKDQETLIKKAIGMISPRKIINKKKDVKRK